MTVERLIAKNKIHHRFVSPDALIVTAILVLRSAKAGAIAASSDGKNLVGIISEHDIVAGLSIHGSTVLKKHVSDLMTENLITCKVSDSILSVMRKMVSEKVRHIPVLAADGTFEGLVAIQDIVSDRLEEVEAESQGMRDYILGIAA
jgi:CBS domain-containing protein